jgi:hypothetical protein
MKIDLDMIQLQQILAMEEVPVLARKEALVLQKIKEDASLAEFTDPRCLALTEWDLYVQESVLEIL